MLEIDLTGKRAIVCGSSQGIGKASAVQLARAGADVTLIARNEDRLKDVLAGLEVRAGQKHSYIVADFGRPDELRAAVSKYLSQGITVNILVNNTGGPKAGEANSAPVSEFAEAFSNHLLCNQIMVQCVLGGMKESGYGRIINIISTSVKQPLKGLGVSNTIRGAVASWAKTLANELGRFGITVNNILPGATKTERLFSLFKTKAETAGRAVDEVQSEWLNEIPAARFAEPEEPGYAVAFLASPLASYINGINLPVDGGRTGCL